MDTNLVQEENTQAVLNPGEHLLQLKRSQDAESGEVFLNRLPVPLPRKDFQFLYALAHLQSQNRSWRLYSAERLLQEVKELFPRYEPPASIKSTGPEHKEAFEDTLEQVLLNMEMALDTPSGKRWRNLLLSQARRYASGLDNAQRFELMSELKQHRDLLELMIQHFEQLGQLPALNSPAARLYRFFVPAAAASESRRRLEGYISNHLNTVRQTLHEVLSQAGQAIPETEILWGKAEIPTWEEATAEGFALSEKIQIEL